MSEAAQRKEKQKWLSRNRSLTMQEDCEVFTSLIQQMRSSKKLFENAWGKVGSSDASCNALQDQRRKVQGDLYHLQENRRPRGQTMYGRRWAIEKPKLENARRLGGIFL